MPATADQPSQPPVVYADPEHGNEPICLDCFLWLRNQATDSDTVKEWGEIQEIARSGWQRLPAVIQEQQGFKDPNGWAKFLLDCMGWSRVKARCSECCRRLALNYFVLAEEMKGAQPAQGYCARCGEAAAEANTLALEVAASGYLPIVPILDPDPKYGHLPKLAASHVASMGILLAEPDNILTKSFWSILHKRILNVLHDEIAKDAPSENFKYQPLNLSAQKLWEIAVVLKQVADMGTIAKHNFAGVVEAHAKDPGNPPKRLALVKAFEWSQQMEPPMTYVELATLLVEHDTANQWNGEVMNLADNIKIAVNKYRTLMPLGTGRY